MTSKGSVLFSFLFVALMNHHDQRQLEGRGLSEFTVFQGIWSIMQEKVRQPESEAALERKSREVSSEHRKQREREEEVRSGCKPSKSTQVTHFLQHGFTSQRLHNLPKLNH